MQQTTSGGKPVRFVPEEHTDFIVTFVPEEIPWLVAGIVLGVGTGIIWWRRRRRTLQAG